MKTIKNEIKMLYNMLTGNEFSDWELSQMSRRELSDLHHSLSVDFREEMEISRQMYSQL